MTNVILVSAQVLRAEFNKSDWCEFCESPEYECNCFYEKPPTPLNNQQTGTLSQMWAIKKVSDGTKIAVVHRYLYPDGTSTRPDPKFLLVDGVVWQLDTKN